MAEPEQTPPVIEAAIQKCGEIDSELSWLKDFLQKLKNPLWEEHDEGYTKAIAIYNSSKTKLATLVSELPSPA